MRKVCSLDDYYAGIEGIKKRLGVKGVLTNCYLPKEAIERYIGLERLYVKESDAGILFVSDEESYYKGYYYWDPNCAVSVLPMDRPLLIRNIYQSGRKKERLCLMEERLKECGFKLFDSTFRMGVTISEKDKIKAALNMFERMLKKGGFVLKYAEKEQLAEILALREHTSEFSLFTFPYTTEEEYYEEIEAGKHICIVNEEGELCAPTYVDFLNGYADGNGVCVKDKYRKLYGMGAALICRALCDAFEKGCNNYYGWVVKTNTVSIRFHENIGFYLTGREEDDWIL